MPSDRIIPPCVAGVFTVMIVLGPAHGQSAYTLENIREAWLQRQRQVRSLRIHWTEEEFIPRGMLSTIMPAIIGADRYRQEYKVGLDEVIPPNDERLRLTSSLILLDSSIRYNGQTGQWSGSDRHYVPGLTIGVYHEGEGRSLKPEGVVRAPHPQGLSTSSPPLEMLANKVLPLRLAVRPLDPELRPFDVDTMRATGRSTLLQNRRCVELERIHGDSALRAWLDPSAGFAVLRLLDTYQSKVVRKIDVQYQQHSGSISVPRSWQILEFTGTGIALPSVRASVTQVELNSKVGEAEIVLDYPPGTIVADVRKPEQRRDYLVQPNGGERAILPDERGLSYTELLERASGLGAYRPLGITRLTALCLIGCVTLPIVFLIWKQKLWRWALHRSCP